MRPTNEKGTQMLASEDLDAVRTIVREEAEARDGLAATVQKLMDEVADLKMEKSRLSHDLEHLRHYLHTAHGLLMSKCVAWGKLTKLTGVGQDHDCPSEKANQS